MAGFFFFFNYTWFVSFQQNHQAAVLVLKWLFSVVSTVTVRFSHESFRQRLTSAALYPWYNFIFLCFNVINIHSHTQKQREIKFKSRIKLNQNCYILRFLSHNTKKCDSLLIRRNSYGTDLRRTRIGFRRFRTGRWRNDHKRPGRVDWFPPTGSYQKLLLLLLIKPWKNRQIDRQIYPNRLRYSPNQLSGQSQLIADTPVVVCPRQR